MEEKKPVTSAEEGIHKNILFFKDLRLSISEWCPFGQNAISTFNTSLDSLKGVKSSLLTGTVDNEPQTTEFNILPKFTRIMLKDFDKYNWIKFEAFVEYPEEVEQIEIVGTHVDKSGFINYGLEMKNIEGKTSNFSLDDTTAIMADLVEDTSIMMDALLTQFQRRILKLIYGDTHFRPKFTVAFTSSLLPEHETVMDYKDGEDQENEINQLVGIAYKFVDLPTNEKAIIGTNGVIFISDNPAPYNHLLSFYSFVRSLQQFQEVFFSRVRKIWDIIKDLRADILHIEKEEAIGILQEELSNLNSDIVLIEEVMEFMLSGWDDMQAIWQDKSAGLDSNNLALAQQLDISREVLITAEKIKDMERVSNGLVDEIKGLRDMVNTFAEKRMREMSKLMATNVQQSSDAQLSMAANVKASRYTGAAVKILSAISSGALGFKISDLLMKALDELNADYWQIVNPHTGNLVNFFGGYLQVIVGVTIWIFTTFIFFRMIKASGSKMKAKKLADDFNLHLRIPIDKRSTPQKIQKFVDSKDVVFHNIETTGQRISWYHKAPKGDDDIFYTLTMAFDMRLGHVIYVHANTEDKKGGAVFTANFLLKDLKDSGLITDKDEAHIKNRMGLNSMGGE
ncbi:MAG: hypothetical protein KAJ33_08190 [Thermoplasmata archaeon]|nr:hypothetical protein [Thermoplasmata archaeon]MCK5398212.1 hypothetical protein [Thermoplasmata archaeon]